MNEERLNELEEVIYQEEDNAAILDAAKDLLDEVGRMNKQMRREAEVLHGSLVDIAGTQPPDLPMSRDEFVEWLGEQVEWRRKHAEEAIEDYTTLRRAFRDYDE